MNKFKKYIFTVAFSVTFFVVAGCTTVAATQGYRSAGSVEAPMQISGELFDITNISIFIDGNKIIDQRLSFLTGEGEFQAYYKGMNISTSCSQSSGLLQAATKCLVFVNNERAATLTF